MRPLASFDAAARELRIVVPDEPGTPARHALMYLGLFLEQMSCPRLSALGQAISTAVGAAVTPGAGPDGQPPPGCPPPLAGAAWTIPAVPAHSGG